MKSLILIAALMVSPFAMAEGHDDHGTAAPAEAAQHVDKMDKKAACEEVAAAAGKKGTPTYKKAMNKCMHDKK